MTSQPAGAARDPHADHDREAIAVYAAGDASMSDRVRLEALIRDCDACARLVEDLRVIATATRHLPPPLANSRDFQLSAADAVRLGGGPWRRILRALGLPAWHSRPFAAAFTTLGIAGLLIAVLPFMSLGSASSALPAAAGATSGEKIALGTSRGFDAASPGGSAGVPGVVYASPVATGNSRNSSIPEDLVSTPGPTTDTAPAPAPLEPRRESPGSPLVFLSLGFIAVGGALFAFGRGTRRRR